MKYTKYNFKFTPDCEFLGELIPKDYVLIPETSEVNTIDKAFKIILDNYLVDPNQVSLTSVEKGYKAKDVVRNLEDKPFELFESENDSE